MILPTSTLSASNYFQRKYLSNLLWKLCKLFDLQCPLAWNPPNNNSLLYGVQPLYFLLECGSYQIMLCQIIFLS